MFPTLKEGILSTPEWLTSFFSKFMLGSDEINEIYKFHPQNEFRFHNIIHAFKNKNHSIGCFTGAGISIPYEFPSWGTFLKNASKEMGYFSEVKQDIEDFKFPEVAQKLEHFNSNLFEEIVKRTFSHSRIKRKLLGVGAFLPFIPFNYLITTNFDYVLEGIYDLAGLEIKPIIFGANAEYARAAVSENLLPLLKIHGEYLHDRILTKEQYDKYYYKDSTLNKQLIELFSTISFLFVGFSLQDENIRIALKEARKVNNSPRHYIILYAHDEQEALERDNYYLDLGVYPIWYLKNHEFAETILGNIGGFLGKTDEFLRISVGFTHNHLIGTTPLIEELIKERPRCHVYKMAYIYSLMDLDWSKIYEPGYLNEAFSRMDRAIGITGNIAEAYYWKGVLNYQRYDIDKSILNFSIAIEHADLDEIKGIFFLQRGLTYLSLKCEPQKALQDFIESLNYLSDKNNELVEAINFYILLIDTKIEKEKAERKFQEILNTNFFIKEVPEVWKWMNFLNKWIGSSKTIKILRLGFVPSGRIGKLAVRTVIWIGKIGLINKIERYKAKKELKNN